MSKTSAESMVITLRNLAEQLEKDAANRPGQEMVPCAVVVNYIDDEIIGNPIVSEVVAIFDGKSSAVLCLRSKFPGIEFDDSGYAEWDGKKQMPLATWEGGRESQTIEFIELHDVSLNDTRYIDSLLKAIPK